LSDLLKNLKAPFWVGILVIAGVAAALFMVSTLKDGSGDGADGYNEYYAYFSDVTGLAVQSRVQMSGIPVGRVETIKLEPDGRARVEFNVRADIDLYEGREARDEDGDIYWKNGATVAKKSASFIGDYFVEVTPGQEGRVLEDGDEIKNVIEAVDVESVMERMEDIAKNVEEVTDSLAAVFGGREGRENVQALLNDLNQILDTLNSFVGENSQKLDRILTNVETISEETQMLTETGGESVRAILRDSEAIVQEVRYIIGQSSSDLQSGLGTLKGTLSRLQSTLDSLNYSLQNIQDITDKVNEGEGTLGELVNNPAIAQRTEQILEDAGEFIGQVTDLKTIIDLRSEYHLNNEQLKNVLGLRLQPSPEKYYLIELIDDFRGSTEVIQTTTQTNEAGEDTLYTTTEVETTDAFKFSVEFARTFFLSPWLGITGRFGLIESSGGIGMNLILLQNRSLEVNADLFDFGEDVNPRLRTFATWNFFSFAYIAGGLDDIMNPRRRDYFIGAGIRFDDEDLKAILTTTGVPSP
jgi:phospholipid/cholesterol/gamma-HCH transport system substrate-binding protein